MKTGTKVRLALIDDHLLFREGLKDLLMDEPDFEVVAEGRDGLEALGLVAHIQMDVLLIDLRLPKLGGTSAIRRIRETYKELKIIVISMYEDEGHKQEAIVAGADAYHSKMDGAADIIQTIRKLIKGEKVISEEKRRALRMAHSPINGASDSFPVLTSTEHKVLEQLCRGLNNKDLAQILCVGERTLKNHLNSIFKKLGVKSRLEAVRQGLEKKLVSIE